MAVGCLCGESYFCCEPTFLFAWEVPLKQNDRTAQTKHGTSLISFSSVSLALSGSVGVNQVQTLWSSQCYPSLMSHVLWHSKWETPGNQHVIHYTGHNDNVSLGHPLRPHNTTRSYPLWFTCLCHLLVGASIVSVSVTLTNPAISLRRQTIPTSPRVKNPRSGNISAGSLSKRRHICTWPCLWFGVIATDKLRTDVLGVVFTPPPSDSPTIFYPPPSFQFP